MVLDQPARMPCPEQADGKRPDWMRKRAHMADLQAAGKRRRILPA